jgi:preprotein translocase subunit SecE
MAEQEKNTPAEKKQPKAAKKPSIFARMGKWFRELKGECKKIVWPSRQQTTNNTAVVLASCLIIGVFIWVLDAVFQFGVSALIG